MNLTLHVWRQKDANDQGGFVTYPANNISPDMSFLEMLDIVNEEIILEGGEPSGELLLRGGLHAAGHELTDTLAPGDPLEEDRDRNARALDDRPPIADPGIELDPIRRFHSQPPPEASVQPTDD